MTSLTDPGEVVDVVIGVDTHVNTHSAAALNIATSGRRARASVEVPGDGGADFASDRLSAHDQWSRLHGPGRRPLPAEEFNDVRLEIVVPLLRDTGASTSVVTLNSNVSLAHERRLDASEISR